MALRLSPYPGALTAATWSIPLTLLTGGQTDQGHELQTREVILSEYLTGKVSCTDAG